MSNTLLRSLRDHILNEDEPLAGLLRKCLMLGAETNSDALRQWARFELNGYGDHDERVPPYRQISGAPLALDISNGLTIIQNQTISRVELPQNAQEYVPESLILRQPVEELERLANLEIVDFTNPGLAVAKTIVNAETSPRQQIIALRFRIPGPMIVGILGQIRTRLVDLIAELSTSTPLAELPGKTQVDAAVGNHIGTQYNTTIHTSSGPTAIGTNSTARSELGELAEVLTLIDEARKATEDLDAGQQGEILDAIDSLDAEVSKAGTVDVGEVRKKAERLGQLAEKIGVPSLTAAVSSAIGAVVTTAISGGFS